MRDRNRSTTADVRDARSITIEQECCASTGYCYRDPMHVHVCTIVLVDDPAVDEHESHACYCGDWWHDR